MDLAQDVTVSKVSSLWVSRAASYTYVEYCAPCQVGFRLSPSASFLSSVTIVVIRVVGASALLRRRRYPVQNVTLILIAGLGLALTICLRLYCQISTRNENNRDCGQQHKTNGTALHDAIACSKEGRWHLSILYPSSSVRSYLYPPDIVHRNTTYVSGQEIPGTSR